MKNKLKYFIGEVLPPSIPIALAIALGVVGCKGATQDIENFPISTFSIEQVEEEFAVNDDDHPRAEKDPLHLSQARKIVAQDVRATSHDGGYWVGGYIENGEEFIMGGSDIKDHDTYLTEAQAADLYGNKAEHKDPNAAPHRSVAESIDLSGSHTQQLKLALAQRAIIDNVHAWNIAGNAVGTDDQRRTTQELSSANATTRDMLEQLKDGLPK
jgi:hypothetical protein